MRYRYQFGQAHCQISFGILLAEDLQEYYAAVVRVEGQNRVICFRHPWQAEGPLYAISPEMCPQRLRDHVAIAPWTFAGREESAKILSGEIRTRRQPSLGMAGGFWP